MATPVYNKLHSALHIRKLLLHKRQKSIIHLSLYLAICLMMKYIVTEFYTDYNYSWLVGLFRGMHFVPVLVAHGDLIVLTVHSLASNVGIEW